MARIRRDIATLGPTWNSTMLWFARAVAALQQRSLDDRTSWTYLAAIHGIDLGGWIGAGVVPPAPPMPSQSEQGRVWNQCQHAGWYFLPWHRGYVAALEAILAAKVVELDGPDDWALPYWNYLDGSSPTARNYPQAFVDLRTPDGVPNPLAIAQRGPGTVLGPKPWIPRDIDCGAMGSHRFTSAPGTLGFGGGQTGFAHFDNGAGAEEFNPHNRVHVMVGGPNPGAAGFMGDPNYAALDPIFWIHHCNIDRMWAAWLTVPGNVQENGAAWSNGPSPRQFVMPDPYGNLNVFTPGQTLPGQPLAPTYDSLDGACIAVLPAGVDSEDGAMPATLSDIPPPPATLVGASSESVTVGTERTATTVAFAPEEALPAGDPVEQRLFLNLENVRGAAPSGVLNVYVEPVSGGEPILADTVALFGLQKASASDAEHGGNGLSIAIDITDLARQLAAEGDADLDRLNVSIEQPEQNLGEPITVERVSVYRQPADNGAG
jgi:tyrosinase